MEKHISEIKTAEYLFNIASPDHAGILANEISSAIHKKISEGVDMKPRNEKFLSDKIKNQQMFVSLSVENELQGALFFEKWNDKSFISTGGMISLFPGVGSGLKKFALNYLVKNFPESEIGTVVVNKKMIKINKDLGYKKVPHEMIPEDYWEIDNQVGLDSNSNKNGRVAMTICRKRYIKKSS